MERGILQELGCCYYKPLWGLCHASLILRQISEHLQDALLTKFLGQFIEVHKSQFFQKHFENCILGVNLTT